MTTPHVEPENVVRDYFLSSKAYDIIKWLAMIALPAFGSFYFAMAQLWGWPNGEKVVGSIVIIDALLGALLSFSSKSYDSSEAKYDGSIEVEQSASGGKLFSLVLNGDPAELDQQTQLVFKVNSI